MTTWYHPNKAGKYHLYCDQLCGTGHALMIGDVHVMEKDEYDAWLNGKRPSGEGPTDGALAHQGRQLFMKLQCLSCHSSKGRAPILEGIYGSTVPLKGGGTARRREGSRIDPAQKGLRAVGSRSCRLSPDSLRTST